jgi:type VI secretion system protein ImpH
MPTKSRRKNTPVISLLQEAPHEYQFVQAIRLIERASMAEGENVYAQSKKPVARFIPPATEAVRFHANNSLGFPSAEIASLSKSSSEHNEQWHMKVNLIGLTGAMGVLPYHYTESILERSKLKDKTLSTFFDLFNHRIISLFYQASVKYRLPVEYERKKLIPNNHQDRDTQTQVLLSLIGLGTKSLTNRQYTNDESLLYYSGLFNQQIRTCANLKQILRNHFNVPVEIQEFVGQWQELIDDVRTRLPSISLRNGRNNCLGKSVMLGSRGWFSQGKIRIILGPLNKQNMDSFAPGTKTLKALNEIVRFYTRIDVDYDFVIRVNRADIPDKIKLDKHAPSIMGWNTWLSSNTKPAEKRSKTFDIVVSASRIN